MAVDVSETRSKLREAQAILDSVHVDFYPVDTRSVAMINLVAMVRAAEENVRKALENLAKLDP